MLLDLFSLFCFWFCWVNGFYVAILFWCNLIHQDFNLCSALSCVSLCSSVFCFICFCCLVCLSPSQGLLPVCLSLCCCLHCVPSLFLSLSLSVSLSVYAFISLCLSGTFYLCLTLCLTLVVCLCLCPHLFAYIFVSRSVSLSLSPLMAVLSCRQADTAQLHQKISHLQATGGACWLRQLNQLLAENQVAASDRALPDPQVCVDGLTLLMFLECIFTHWILIQPLHPCTVEPHYCVRNLITMKIMLKK